MKQSGRPRDESKKQVILDATLALLVTHNVKTLTVEAIAQQAGVGKTTLYRWWPKKCSLVIEATMQQLLMTTQLDVKKSPKIILYNHFISLVDFFCKREGEILLELLSEAQFDEEIRVELINNIIEPRRQAIKQVIVNGISSGVFTKRQDVEWMIDAIYGPIYYRALIKHQKLDQNFAKQHINYWLKMISK